MRSPRSVSLPAASQPAVSWSHFVDEAVGEAAVSPDPSRPVRYFTSDGSARAGVHYEARSGTLEEFGPLTVPVLDNSEVNPPRTFFVNFVSLANPGLTNRHEVILLDNEIPDLRDPDFASEVFPVAELGQAGLVRRDDTIVWHNAHASELVFFSRDGRIERRRPLRTPPEMVNVVLAEMPDGVSLLAASGELQATPELQILGAEETHTIRPDLPSGRITALHVSRDGQRWVGMETLSSGRWLYRLGADGKRELAVLVDEPSSVIVFTFVSRITESSPGMVDLALRNCTSHGRCWTSRAQLVGGTVVEVVETPPVFGRSWLGSDADGRSLLELGRFDKDRPWVRYAPDGTLDPTFISGPTLGMQFLGTQSDGAVIALKLEDPNVYPSAAELVRLPPRAPQRGQFVASPGNVGEGTDAVIQVFRTGSTTTAASVRLRTLDLTAKAGADYDALEVLVNFAPLEVSKEVRVRGRADRLWEGTELFGIELLEPSGADLAQSSWDVPVFDAQTPPALALARSASGTPQLVVTNPDGVALEIQSSTGLREWTLLETSSDRLITKPLNPELGSARFYRLRSQP